MKHAMICEELRDPAIPPKVVSQSLVLRESVTDEITKTLCPCGKWAVALFHSYVCCTSFQVMSEHHPPE